MLVSDIDGTLVNGNNEVSHANRAALLRLQKRGVLVTLATGRSWGTTRALCRELGISMPVILCNGAQIYDPAAGVVLFEHSVSPLDAMAAFAALCSPSVELCVVTSEAMYVSARTAGIEAYLYQGDEPRVAVGDLAHFVLSHDLNILKITAVGSPGQLDRIAHEVRSSFPDLNLVQSDPHSLEILPRGISKGRALRQLCTLVGVSMNQVIALGNAPNDLEMLRAARVGVAVADAHPEVLAVADWITSSSLDDALAAVVETFFDGDERRAAAVYT